MTVDELQRFLMAECDKGNGDKEVRIGEQIESGPYLNAGLASIYRSTRGGVIICANDDEQWFDETTGIDSPTSVDPLDMLWPEDEVQQPG